MIREEFVTRRCVAALEEAGWSIITYDFPNSGAGVRLRPDGTDEKNLKSIIPDIIAERGDEGLIFENKERFFIGDFRKIDTLRTSTEYLMSLDNVFGGNRPGDMRYGVAIPRISSQTARARQHYDLVDFCVFVSRDGDVIVDYERDPPINFLPA